MKTPEEFAVAAATRFNANDPGHFPGRPLFEGLVADAVRQAVAAEREAVTRQLVAAAQRFPDQPLVASVLVSEAEAILERGRS